MVGFALWFPIVITAGIFFQTTLQSLANKNEVFVFFFFYPCAVFSSFTLTQQHFDLQWKLWNNKWASFGIRDLDLRPGTFYLKSDLWVKEHSTVNWTWALEAACGMCIQTPVISVYSCTYLAGYLISLNFGYYSAKQWLMFYVHHCSAFYPGTFCYKRPDSLKKFSENVRC